MKLTHILSLCLNLAISPIKVSAQSHPTAHDPTHNITYTGLLLPVRNSNPIESFQNIRFGQSTNGTNRFAPPKPFTYPDNTVVQATKAGAACPQNTVQSFLGTTQVNDIELSEDCLTLLVVRPNGTGREARLPVMVWIYGGGDEMGAANISLWEPSRLVAGAAEKGTPVIWVAMNYRVNIFGFPNNPHLHTKSSLNAGLLDQRLALEWIASNIPFFGGDPNNITLFGQSDGATGIGLHITSHGGRGNLPFQRAIMQSGGPTGDPGVSTNDTMIATHAVAGLVGCTQPTSEGKVNCLRNLAWQDLLIAVVKYENQTAARGTYQDIFYPTLDGDSGYIPAPPSVLLRTGRFHRNMSVIAGWTYNDGSIFTDPELADPTLTDSSGVSTYLRRAYPHLSDKTVSTLTEDLYPTSSFQTRAAQLNTTVFFLQAAQIYRDINFACQSLFAAQQFNKYSPGVPVYVYDFNTTSYGLLLQLAGDGAAARFGVLHTSEILFVYNNANFGGLLPVTREQNGTMERVSGSWARFATTGDPSGERGVDDGSGLAGWRPAFAVRRGGAGATSPGADEADGGADGAPGARATKVSAGGAKQGLLREVSIRAIGGPQAGQFTASFDGGDGARGESELLRRCAFVNSVRVQREIGT